MHEAINILDLDEDDGLIEYFDSDVPVKPTGIETVRKIVEGHGALTFTWGKKGDGILVDATTANMLCTVFDVLRPDLQEKVSRFIAKSPAHFIKVVNIGWSGVK